MKNKMYTNSKKISGDAINWDIKNNSTWDNINKEQFIDVEQNIYTSIIIKMKKFTYLSMDLVLSQKQKECYKKYHSMTESNRIQLIAEDMNLSPATVYKHIRKADEKLYALGELFLKSCGYKSYYDGIKNTILKSLDLLDYDEREIIKQYYLYGNSIKYIAKRFELPSDIIYELYKSGTKKIIKTFSISRKHLTDLRHGIINAKRISRYRRGWRFYNNKE